MAAASSPALRRAQLRAARFCATQLRGAWLLATVLLAVSLLTVGVVACGGDESAEGTSSTASVSPGPVSTQSPSAQSSTTAGTPTSRPPVTVAPPGSTSGSPDSGDPYFPASGNGGYDVQSYDISLDIDMASGRIAGTTTVDLRATQELSAFYLDLSGLQVSKVDVGGAETGFGQEGDELRIDLPETMAAGASVSVIVQYAGVPTPTAGKSYDMGWQQVGDTIFTIDEPLGAATWFPVNDTPADKATYTFSLTVPAAYTALANGVLTGTETAGASRTFHWRMDQPMASYLAQVAVGEFTLETSTSTGGVPIRNYFAADLAPAGNEVFARLGEVIDYYVDLLGPYPFSVYGVVVADAASGAAMENQTLSLYGSDVVEKQMGDPVTGAIYLSHELAHQWFGDSVTLERWDDVWLNEGFATYASWLWLEHDMGPRVLQALVEQSLQMVAEAQEPPPGTPGPDNLFGTSVYRRGALTMHALRLTVGDESFLSILRAWADAHKYGNAETADFIALVKELAPQVPAAQLDALFQAWLYEDELPELPVIPDGPTVVAGR